MTLGDVWSGFRLIPQKSRAFFLLSKLKSYRILSLNIQIYIILLQFEKLSIVIQTRWHQQFYWFRNREKINTSDILIKPSILLVILRDVHPPESYVINWFWVYLNKTRITFIKNIQIICKSSRLKIRAQLKAKYCTLKWFHLESIV